VEQLTVAQDRLLTPKEAARYLSMTERFLEARRTRGDGPPFIKVSENRVRYSIADLRSWAAERRCTSTADEPARA
jgi:hypothetical protein